MLRDIVFLGGTVANNKWRARFTQALVACGVPTELIFNPVVENWDALAQAREEDAKRRAAVHVYYIASPMQEDNPLSAYSMVEATMALYDHGDTAVVIFDYYGMTGHPLKAMKQTEEVLRARHPAAKIFTGPRDAIQAIADINKRS
jgi:hypothetical protein